VKNTLCSNAMSGQKKTLQYRAKSPTSCVVMIEVENLNGRKKRQVRGKNGHDLLVRRKVRTEQGQKPQPGASPTKS